MFMIEFLSQVYKNVAFVIINIMQNADRLKTMTPNISINDMVATEEIRH